LRTQLAELNKDRKNYKVKKLKDNVAWQLDCPVRTSNNQDVTFSDNSVINNSLDASELLFFFYQCQSIINTITELQVTIYQHSPKIIGIAEA